MNNIGWGIIGVPNGFQHISQGITANESISRLDDRIRREEYKEENLFAIIYDTAIVGTSNTRQLMTYFVQYNFSKEAEKERPGSFYGSYIALPGRLPSNIECCKEIVRVLQELSCYNQEIFMEGDKFKTNYSNDYELPPELGEAVEKIIKNTVMGELPTEKFDIKKSIIVYANSPSEVFLNSVELYDIYSRIYTSNNEDYCRYIEQDRNINSKEVFDLIRESSDIVDTRQREINRRKKEEQDELEAEKIEKERQKKLFDEKFEFDRNEAVNEFNGLQELYLYACVDNANLSILVEKFKDSAGSSVIEELNFLSENLKKYIELSNKFSKDVENKKTDIDREIRRLEGGSYQLNEQPNLASSSLNNEPVKKPSKAINNYSSNPKTKKQNHNTYSNRVKDDYSHLDNDGFSAINIIIWIVIIVAALAIIASAYFLFFDGGSKHSQAANAYSSAQTSDENSTTETVTENSSSIPVGFSDECNHAGSSTEYYLVSTLDVTDVDSNLRLDGEKIISNITESILNRDGYSNVISDEDKNIFKKMLINCNDELNYIESNSIDQESAKIYKIDTNSKLSYIKLPFLKRY